MSCMAFRLSPEMMKEIAVSALGKRRSLVLVKTPAQADKIADKIREALRDEIVANPEAYRPARGRTVLIRPIGSNPSLIQTTNGGWVFVWPADDMGADEDIGDPEFVYWPSEGGAYEKVTYSLWKKHRAAGDIYRPVVVTQPRKATGPRTAWDRLLDDEDDQ